MTVATGQDMDLFVQVRGLDFNTIEFIQGLEKRLDAALLPMGFSRQVSTKSGEWATFLYRQFAVTIRQPTERSA